MIVGCSSGPKESAGELVIGVSQDYRATDVFSHKGFNCLVFQTLVKMDTTGKIGPLLAESWEVAKDGKSYIFHLRKDILFSDGTPVTAPQVKASMLYRQTVKRKRGPREVSGRPGSKPDNGPAQNKGPAQTKDSGVAQNNKKNGSAQNRDEGKIKREYSVFDNQRYNLPSWCAFQLIDVIDDYTLRFVLSQPYTLFLNELATTHMYPVIKADNNEEVTGYIGTGPYKIDTLKRTQYMTLVKNEYFRQGEVNIDRIRLKVIPDAETRAIALEAGEIHMTGYDHFDKIPNESVSRLQNLPFVKVQQMTSVDHPSVSFLTINYKKGPFSHSSVRHAVALAIDPASMDAIMSETGRTINGPFPKDYLLCSPEITGHRFDPDQARRLLTEAGWSDSDQDGILDKDGQKFFITLCFNSFDPQYKTIAEIVQAQLKAVGIELKLQMMELGAHITAMRNGDYDLAMWPMMAYHMFFYTGHPSWLNVYNSPELDKAFTLYLHGKDEKVRRKAVSLTQKYIVESNAFPLFFERFDVVAWNKNYLKKFDPQPLGWDLSLWLWKAFVEPS
jgi:ABC-type transport system substrate-binding protein